MLTKTNKTKNIYDMISAVYAELVCHLKHIRV